MASFLLVFKVLANVIYQYIPTLCGLIGHNLYSVIKAIRKFLLFLYSSPPYFFRLIFGKKCSKSLSVSEKLINQTFCLSDLYQRYPEIVAYFHSFLLLLSLPVAVDFYRKRMVVFFFLNLCYLVQVQTAFLLERYTIDG